MAKHTHELIPLARLNANTENDRFMPVEDEDDAIELMVEKHEDELLELAMHIVSNGMNPSERVIVTPDTENHKKYTVLEGNRRVIVLKFLNDYKAYNLSKFPFFLKEIKVLSEEFKKTPILKVDCASFENPDDANEWLRLKHTGKNSGSGTVEWDSQQKDRFKERTGGKASPAMQALKFLDNSSYTNPAIKSKLAKVPSTSLARLVADPKVREFLGVEIENGDLKNTLVEEEVVKGLSQVVNDLTKPNFTVHKIYHQSDREEYLKKFPNSSTPDQLKKVSGVQTKTTSKKANKKGKKKVPATSLDRNCLIPKTCVLSISESRLNHIYEELLGLKVEDYANAVAVLFRVFIELSIDSFIESKKIARVREDDKLRVKAEAVCSYMEANIILTKNQLKPTRTAITSPHAIFSINTFNAFVHNKDFHPSPRELKTSWNNLQTFIEKIWENI